MQQTFEHDRVAEYHDEAGHVEADDGGHYGVGEIGPELATLRVVPALLVLFEPGRPQVLEEGHQGYDHRRQPDPAWVNCLLKFNKPLL